MMIERPQITQEMINQTFADALEKLNFRIKQKGVNSLVSTHEIWGIIDEEVIELKESIKKNDLFNIRQELLDCIVASMLGLMSLDTMTDNKLRDALCKVREAMNNQPQ